MVHFAEWPKRNPDTRCTELPDIVRARNTHSVIPNGQNFRVLLMIYNGRTGFSLISSESPAGDFLLAHREDTIAGLGRTQWAVARRQNWATTPERVM
jgi:hypothetical protein